MTSSSDDIQSGETAEELARRTGERRRTDAAEAAAIAEERRQADRRQRKPGIGALVNALLGKKKPTAL